jgi:hypothetical protein
MAEDSLSKQVMDAISAPAKKVTDFVSKMTAGVSTAPNSAVNHGMGVETDYSRSEHAKDVAAANASYARSAAGSAHGQTQRRERLTRKYGSGK